MKNNTKIIILFSFFLMLFSFTAKAISDADTLQQADTIKVWHYRGINSFSFSQTGFHNWAEGGESAYSGTAFSSWNINYKKKNFVLSNYINLGFGMLKPEDGQLRKTDDIIDFGQNFSWKAVDSWYYSTQYTMKTQFAPGYTYPDDTTRISNFFAPATLTSSLGMRFSKDEHFSFFISPASGSFTFVLDQELANRGVGGVTPAEYEDVIINDSVTEQILISEGKNCRPSFGFLVEANINRNLIENVNLNSKISIRNNYLDPNINNRWRFDVDWEMFMNFTINKFLSASIRAHLIYDHDIPITYTETINGEEITKQGPRTQFKDIIGIGIAYKIGD